MTNIEIHIAGDQWLLDSIEKDFLPNIQLSQDRNRITIAISSEISDEAATAIAEVLISRINGAIRIREQNLDAPKISISGALTIIREKSVGQLITGRSLIRKPLTDKAFQIDTLLSTAENSTMLRDLLTVLSSDNSFWIKAMNVVDTINHYKAELIPMMERDVSFKELHRRFIGTASNFNTLLADSRHGQMGDKKHSDPVTLSEAKIHINLILQTAIG